MEENKNLFKKNIVLGSAIVVCGCRVVKTARNTYSLVIDRTGHQLNTGAVLVRSLRKRPSTDLS